MIDSHAIVDPSAQIAEHVTVGPWTVIGPNVTIESGTWIGSHVVIKGPARIGHDNKIFQFVSIGDTPQDKKYQGETTRIELGDRNIVREFCTMHRGTAQGGGSTKIGHDNLFMAYTHIAHDCVVANHTIFANYAALAGHVVVEDYATLSAYSAIHQFCHIGAYSFIAPATLVRKDVLPYVLVEGHEAHTCGLNTIGLKRNGFNLKTINALRRAYKIIFRSGLTVEQALEMLNPLLDECQEVKVLFRALEYSHRGVLR